MCDCSNSRKDQGVDFCGTFDSNDGEHTLSIADIQSNSLSMYGDTFNDSVDEFQFRERLEDIYINNFSISKDIDVYEIFDDYYFEENLTDKKFCKRYKIVIEEKQ